MFGRRSESDFESTSALADIETSHEMKIKYGETKGRKEAKKFEQSI